MRIASLPITIGFAVTLVLGNVGLEFAAGSMMKESRQIFIEVAVGFVMLAASIGWLRRQKIDFFTLFPLAIGVFGAAAVLFLFTR